MTVNAVLVTDFGTRGKCVNCANASEFTADIQSKRYCKSCVAKNFPNVKVEFEKTDAKFSCPASISQKVVCDAKELTYDEFYVGSCCENAALWTYELGKLCRQMTLQHIYEDARKAEDAAEKISENADAKVVEAKKILENLEQAAADAVKSLGERKKWRKTVQKRALFLAKEAMKEDNSDIEEGSDYEPDDEEVEDAEVEEEADEEREELLEKMTCKVCMEKFDDEHPEATIIPCGHKSCFQCLSSLPNKVCPTCRADFAIENVYKLY